jgi:hypothetical protein
MSSDCITAMLQLGPECPHMMDLPLLASSVAAAAA